MKKTDRNPEEKCRKEGSKQHENAKTMHNSEENGQKDMNCKEKS